MTLQYCDKTGPPNAYDSALSAEPFQLAPQDRIKTSMVRNASAECATMYTRAPQA
jgi:hypothetical protein